MFKSVFKTNEYDAILKQYIVIFFLPVAKLFTTPIQSAEAIAESTALPPFFKTIKKRNQLNCFSILYSGTLLDNPASEHSFNSTATAPFSPTTR